MLLAPAAVVVWSEGIKVNYHDQAVVKALKFIDYAFPGKYLGQYHHNGELVLLEANTNLLKEKAWGTGEVRTEKTMNEYVTDGEYDKAINACKAMIFVLNYHQQQNVQNILVAQATRLGQAFDDAESELVQIPTSDQVGGIAKQYQKFGLGDRWRAWIRNRNQYASNRARQFIDTWVPIIEDTYSSGSDSDGDEQMNNVETNPEILERVAALKEAYNAAPASFLDPFPDS